MRTVIPEHTQDDGIRSPTSRRPVARLAMTGSPPDAPGKATRRSRRRAAARAPSDRPAKAR